MILDQQYFSFDLLSLALIASMAQGLFILSVLILRYKLRSAQHILLFLLVLALVWYQAEFLVIRSAIHFPVKLFYGTRYGAWLLLGPLYLSYLRATLNGFTTSRIRLYLHFVPFTVFSLVIPLVAGDFLGFHQVHYGMISPFYPINRHVTLLQGIYTAVFMIQFIHLFVYLLISYSEIKKYESEIKANFSSIDQSNISWLKTLSVTLLVVVVFATSFLVLFFTYHLYDRNLDYLYVIPLAALVYVVAYKVAGVEWSKRVSSPVTLKYEKSSLKESDAMLFQKRLEAYMAKAKPYLNNELRLQDLALAVDVPPYHLSQVINEQLKSSFFDFINRHRVSEAKKLITANPHTPLLEIGFQSGFNNKTSFTNAFKKFDGQTPQAFRNSIKIPQE